MSISASQNILILFTCWIFWVSFLQGKMGPCHLTFLQESLWLYSSIALKELCSWVVPGWPSVEIMSLKYAQVVCVCVCVLSVMLEVHALVCTELWTWCPLRSMPILLSAAEIPYPSNCSQHLKGNPPAWHIVAATTTLCDALKACYLRVFLGQQN